MWINFHVWMLTLIGHGVRVEAIGSLVGERQQPSLAQRGLVAWPVKLRPGKPLILHVNLITCGILAVRDRLGAPRVVPG